MATATPFILNPYTRDPQKFIDDYTDFRRQRPNDALSQELQEAVNYYFHQGVTGTAEVQKLVKDYVSKEYWAKNPGKAHKLDIDPPVTVPLSTRASTLAWNILIQTPGFLLKHHRPIVESILAVTGYYWKGMPGFLLGTAGACVYHKIFKGKESKEPKVNAGNFGEWVNRFTKALSSGKATVQHLQVLKKAYASFKEKDQERHKEAYKQLLQAEAPLEKRKTSSKQS